MKLNLEKAIKLGVKHAMEECELAMGMTLLEAIEKQISKRPIERFTGDEYICECPACKGTTYTPDEVVIESIQYCAWCGQKLDWSYCMEDDESGDQHGENQ